MRVDAGRPPQHNPHATQASVSHTVVMPAPATPMVISRETCDCSIPQLTEAKRTWKLSVAVLVTHILALLILGFVNPWQWISSLAGIISSSILLCCQKKLVYACVAGVYIPTALFDLLAAIYWTSADDNLEWAMIFPIVALLTTIGAIIFGFQACLKMDDTLILTGVQAPQPPPHPTMVVQMGQPGAVNANV